MRPIDADALGIGPCKPEIFNDPAYGHGWNSAIKIIQDAPTIDPVHAAGACYCRECRYFQTSDDPKKFSTRCANVVEHGGICGCPKADDFCSYGEIAEADND